jgi:hypothetical protein
MRLVEIFSTFEYVTTNGFGSQITYAAYCGAKVSVFGPNGDPPRRPAPATPGREDSQIRDDRDRLTESR